MRKQAKTNTKPELEVRAELRKLGLRYRVDLAPVPSLRRRADVLFPTAKVAVFVHGCFWHGCPEHARATKSNTKWWADKIAANQTRDADTQTQLLAAGWLPIIVWEHEAPKSAASRVAAIVGDRLETVAIRAA
jgi:DNA mismatch endonuclease (patch repair protein)